MYRLDISLVGDVDLLTGRKLAEEIDRHKEVYRIVSSECYDLNVDTGTRTTAWICPPSHTVPFKPPKLGQQLIRMKHEGIALSLWSDEEIVVSSTLSPLAACAKWFLDRQVDVTVFGADESPLWNEPHKRLQVIA